MTTSAKVLVVDDDAVVGRSFDRVLSRKGYAVSTALSGEEALDKIEGRDYDVVFADIKMPGIDGLEVTRRIKERCPWTPVVIVTGYGTAEHEAEARVLGANGFVHKPLSPEMIEGITLKALLDRPRSKSAKTPAESRGEAAAATGAEATEGTGEDGGVHGALRFVRNIGLFLAAPFVGLAYAIALPFVGLGMIVVMGFRAYSQSRSR